MNEIEHGFSESIFRRKVLKLVLFLWVIFIYIDYYLYILNNAFVKSWFQKLF